MVENHRCFVIAEAGVNHNGSIELAKQLVDVAVVAGADAVKFQTFKAEKLVSINAPKAEYQTRQTGKGNQFEMLKALELTDEMHKELVVYCEERNIEFMSTAFDQEPADYLIDLGIKRVKVPSGEVTNKPLIEALAKNGLPIILSTGMANLEEVKEAVSWIKAVRHKNGFTNDDISILHCTSNYPTDFGDVNLRAMDTLANELKLPVGYSDHTNGILISTLAVARGATIIEKHFTTDRNLPGPDHQASLEPDELITMIRQIRVSEKCLGDGVKRPVEAELTVRDVARRSLVLCADLKAGEAIQETHISILRPGTGIEPKYQPDVIGKKTTRDLEFGHTLAWGDIEK